MEIPGVEPSKYLPKLSRADINIAWCEEFLRIPEGKNRGQKLKMAPFMQDDFRAIYNNRHGTRRAIITRGRKNGKTIEAAMILLLHLCGPEHKKSTQLFSAAQSREQAAIIFNLAAKMVRLTPELNESVAVRESAKQLMCIELDTTYRALSAEATTAYGLNPALILHDELGQVRGPRFALYEALETAVGAQEEPLSIIISTQAANDGDLLSALIDDAEAAHDPRTVLRMHKAPDKFNPFGKAAIRKANPAFDIFMNRQEVLAMAAECKRMPAREAEYRNYVLNQRVEVSNPFVSRSVWMACEAQPSDLTGVPVYAGLDLSSVSDLTALVMIGERDRVWQVQPTFWLPEDDLREKSQRDRVPWDVWRRQGFLKTTPGASVAYEYVAEYLKREVFSKYRVRKIAFDRWNFQHLKPWLIKAGLSEYFITEHFVEFGQGLQSMSPALRALEQAVNDAKIAHGGHPIMTHCVANAVVVMDDAGNRKLSKRKSTGKIDGLVALAMAFGVAPPVAPIDIESLIV